MLITSHFQLLRDLIRCCHFFDQPEDCLNWGNASTDGMSQLDNLEDSWPFVNANPVTRLLEQSKPGRKHRLSGRAC